jgi:hypothetical protein
MKQASALLFAEKGASADGDQTRFAGSDQTLWIVEHCGSKDGGVRRTGRFDTDVQLVFEIVSRVAEKKHGASLLTLSRCSHHSGRSLSDL